MAPHANDADLVLRVVSLTSTLWVASAMVTTSAVFLPSLLRPLQSPLRASAPPADRPPQLTPQIDAKQTTDPFSSQQDSSTGAADDVHKAVARQFTRLDTLAFRTQVPLELFLIGAYGYLALTSRRSSSFLSALRTPWAASAALFLAVFPLTGGFMVPHVRTLKRVAGEEERPELYEDALQPDRETERASVVKALETWNALNVVRSAVVLSAGGFGVWGWAVGDPWFRWI